MQANGMIFWDWNGTLMDDVDFTHGCLNWMLETHGYPQRYDLAAYREIFGFPIEEYYLHAGFDFARHPYAELAEQFMERYNAGVDTCPPSAHAVETLAELSRRGWRQSVLSASRRDYLIEQVVARGLQGFFVELLGLADIYGVSKVQAGRRWLAQSGISPAACVMVGDTQHDAEVAAALGTKCVLYTGGHQSRKRLEAVCPHVIDDLAQLPQLLEIDVRGDVGGVRELLGEYIRTVKGGTIEPHVNNNWKIVGNNWKAADHQKAVQLLREGKLALNENADARTLPGKAITTADIAKF